LIYAKATNGSNTGKGVWMTGIRLIVIKAQGVPERSSVHVDDGIKVAE